MSLMSYSVKDALAASARRKVYPPKTSPSVTPKHEVLIVGSCEGIGRAGYKKLLDPMIEMHEFDEDGFLVGYIRIEHESQIRCIDQRHRDFAIDHLNELLKVSLVINLYHGHIKVYFKDKPSQDPFAGGFWVKPSALVTKSIRCIFPQKELDKV